MWSWELSQYFLPGECLMADLKDVFKEPLNNFVAE